MEIPKSFLGYKRENGRAGTRNHVIILPVDDISNACAEAVANNIKGTIALPHSYGRLQFGADLELHFRTMIGTGCNPNVAAVIVIGIEPKWTKKIVDGIAKTGKPVEGFHIERTGDIGTTMKASKKAQEFVMWASEKQREECPISDLWISVKCGESDTTSGLAANPTVGNLMDKLEPLGVHLCFGETSELTGAEKVCATRGATKEASSGSINETNGSLAVACSTRSGQSYSLPSKFQIRRHSWISHKPAIFLSRRTESPTPPSFVKFLAKQSALTIGDGISIPIKDHVPLLM